MSNNLYKYGYNYIPCEDKRIIDNNVPFSMLKQRLAGRGEETQMSSEPEEQGFTEGLFAEEIQVPVVEDEAEPAVIKQPVYEGPSPEELIAEAEREIEQMKQAAKEEILAEQKKVLEQSKEEGYQEGYAQGQKEAEALKSQVHQERQKLQAEYEEKLSQIEPELISVLTEVYEHILQVDFTSYRQIIVTLISNTLHQIDGGKNYIIHVASSDYPYVTMQKAQIVSNCPASMQVEFVEDITLKQNECLIETDNGIFDCGLGTQLDELKQKLKLLSFER